MLEKKENRKENHPYRTSKWIAVMTAVCMSAMLAGCGSADPAETETAAVIETAVESAVQEDAEEDEEAGTQDAASEEKSEMQSEAETGSTNATAGTAGSEAQSAGAAAETAGSETESAGAAAETAGSETESAGTAAETAGSETESAGVTVETAEEETGSAEETEAQNSADSITGQSAAYSRIPEIADIEISEELENTEDGGHAITADGETADYANTKITKTGEADGDEADFYGENAAIFAANGGTLTLTDMVINTNGTHANAVFSYGEGTTVNVSNSVIETSGNCSGGLMTTGGGTMNAENLNIHTTGNSSAAIRSDRGGGTVTVTGGKYETDGTGSPVIYSTADITVNDAELTSTASQGVVVEGKNSVTLNNVTLTADNNTKNSDKSDTYQAVMIYQSMSGDAAEGLSSFTMNGGTLTNKNGDIFFVNNTVTEISLSGAEIVNEDENGVFLRAEAAGWGNEGSNGGQVTLTVDAQEINGDMIVDEVSNLNLYLKNNTVFTGAVNTDGQEGEVYVDLDENSVWTLTADSYITSLTCDEDSIILNGHTLYVNGEAYSEGTAATGEAIEVTVTSESGNGGEMGTPPEGAPGEGGPGNGDNMGNPPEGAPCADGQQMGTPPEKPDGDDKGGPGSGTPPTKQEGT